MDDKQVLRYVINGFELIPAKFGFENSYTTKTGKATPNLSKEINDRIKKNFPQTRIRTSYDPFYKTINFYRTMLENLVMEDIIKLLLSEEDYVSLKKKSFTDRPDRTGLFVKKLEKRSPIDLTNGNKVVIHKIVIDDDVFVKKPAEGERPFKDLVAVLPTLTTRSKITFYDNLKAEKANAYKISAFAKTPELGGLGKKGTTKPEQREIANLQKQFEDIDGSITLIIDGERFENIDGIADVRANRKADFAFTSNREPVIFISYKPGSSPKDMISYGGITKEAKIKEVEAFINAVKSKTSSMKDTRVEYGYPVQDPEVIQKVLYGFQYNEETAGENSVQFLIQGTSLKLEEENGVYTLKASHILKAPEIPTGEYAPYYNARYANDRSQFGVQNCRFTVVPFGARKNIRDPFK